MMHTLPTVDQAYALVIQDKSQKGIAGIINKEIECVDPYTKRKN